MKWEKIMKMKLDMPECKQTHKHARGVPGLRAVSALPK